MLKRMILASVLGLSLSQLATAETMKFPAGAQYLQSFDGQKYPDQFDKFFTGKKFGVVKAKGEFSATPNLQWLNRMYIGLKPGQQILARTGLELKNLNYGQLYSVNGKYLLHVPTGPGTGTAFYLMGYSQTESEEFVKQILQFAAVTVTQNRFFDFSLLPKAYADDEVPCSVPVDARHESQLQGFVTETANCIAKGVWSATLELPMLAWQGGKAVYNDPAKAWEQVGNMASMIPKIVTEAGNVFSQLIDGFKALTGAEKAKMICEVITAVGTGAAITFFTAGAGAPAMFASISKVLIKMAELTGGSKFLKMAESMGARSETAAAKLAMIKNSPDSAVIKAQADYAGLHASAAPANARISQLNSVIYGFPRTEADVLRAAERMATKKLEFGNSFFTGAKNGRDFIGNVVDPYSGAARDLKFLRERFNLTTEQQAKLQRLLVIAEERADPKSDLYRQVGISMRPRIDGKYSAPVTSEQWDRLGHVLADYDADLKKFVGSIDAKATIDTKSYQYISEGKLAELKKTQEDLYAEVGPLNNLINEKQNAYGNALVAQGNIKVKNIRNTALKGAYLGYLACDGARSSLKAAQESATAK